ncbi:MAG: hypothetical protein GWO08_11370 [Gammaproteobacteria bacterium]|nr:hypothetical protein [Phycisphaerae bacterium]NIR94233.1 hypothetical protein [Gammaproteobacteria bacterium]NIW49393.1 hypothetical protein [Gammaproteobacteria bacterium]
MERFIMRLLLALSISSLAMSHMTMADEFSVNQSVEQYSAVSEIYGEAISQAHGAFSVNQASGDGNAQNNSRAIAVTQEAGVAIAITVNKQAVEMSMAAMPDEAISRISDNAFNGTSGLIAINQASGNGRQ